jgi:hypothetical protein
VPSKPGQPLPQPRKPEERARCKELYQSGLNYREIAEETGVPKATLAVWAKREQWKRDKSDALAITTPTPVADDVPDDLATAAAEYELNMRRASVIVSRRIAQMEPDTIVARADRIKQLDSTARKALKIETEKPFQVIQIGVLAQPVKVRPGQRDRLGAPKQLLQADERDTITLDAEVTESSTQ